MLKIVNFREEYEERLREEGRREGREEVKREKLEIARKFVEKLGVDEVSEITGISKELLG